MIIRGILDRSLSNQICIRGFARIKELARISKANPEYQRELMDKQKSDISNFLTKENYLFFPEVILSLKLKYDSTAKKAKTDKTPIQSVEEGGAFTSNIDGISITRINKKSRIIPAADISGKSEIVIVEIEISEAKIVELINANEHPLHRIDGNHRLSAAEQIKEDYRIERMDIPFCIVLLEEVTSLKFNPETKLEEKFTDKKYEKFERVVFYNINSKSEPLTLEQNLKAIIDDGKNFDDEELKRIFGISGLLARKLINRVSLDRFSGISHLINPSLRNLSKTIFEALKEALEKESEDAKVEMVFESFKAVEQLYLSEQKLRNNNSEGLFTAFLYYNIIDKAKYSFFKEWVLDNHIFDIKEAKYQTLIEIFDKLSDQNIKVFVAMPFFSKPEVESYNQAYQRVIDRIRKANETIKIALYPIMQDAGETYNISNQMIEQIKNCTIFIADISLGNANVAFELGYAKNAGKSVIMIKRNNDDTKTPFDYAQDLHCNYDEKAIHTLEDVLFKNIKKILQERGFILKGDGHEK